MRKADQCADERVPASRLADLRRAAGSRRASHCRYQGWSYGLEARCAQRRHARRFRPSQLGLRRVHCRVFAGAHIDQLRADAAPSRKRARDGGALHPISSTAPKSPIGRTIRSQQLESRGGKLVRVIPLRSGAPEYTVGHGGAIPAAAWERSINPERVRRRTASRYRGQPLMAESGGFGLDRGYERYPLLRGHKTGSRDGGPVAPLLGTITGYDGSATDLHFGPMTFGLAYSDHVVTVSIYASRPVQHGLRDHLARERVGCRGQGLRSRRSDVAVGRDDDRGQEDHRAQSGRRGFAFLRARCRCPNSRISRAVFSNGT